ncbi:hypothetical protein [Patulibacter minatonensis]|uniref:hypothetical protein n=1 Tax=Patulibacter minatonensis TaxID=298163 RepID=UPI00047E5002|nr:hypothetical protein [Patulibacter minatonensis]
MADERPRDDVAPDEPAGPCRSCGVPTTTAQRYCLGCGELLGARRLDPLAVLRDQGVPAPAPVPAAAPAGRAAPMAAAVAAIAVAGLAGSLVAGGGEGARAAVVTRPTAAAAPAPAPTTTAAKPSASAPVPSSSDTSASDDTSLTADAAPAEVTAAPAATDTGTDTSADTGGDTGDDTTTPDEPAIPPHVWLLAIEGPRAQEAVDRVAEQGVRLTGVRPVSADTIGNATTLVTGNLPAGAAAAPGTTTTTPAAGTTTTVDPSAAPTASLPEELTAADQTWRSYVDVQPGGADALPGACADPPAGDAAAAALAARTPFGRITALRTDDLCAKGTASLETLGNDVSSGDSLPSFSYATLGGCAPPERTVVALPDQVSDTVTAITESTEYQESGVVIVTTVGAADPCPTTPAAPAAPVDPAAALPPAPTVVLRADAKAGSSLDVATDLRSLTRLAASTLGVDPPGTSGADDVPALELPAAGG